MFKKIDLVVSCPISSRSGYGAHSRDILRSLIKLGKYNIKVVATQWGSTPNDALDPTKENDLELINLMVDHRSITVQPSVWLQVCLPNEFQPQASKANVLITAGIETTKIPNKEWILGANRADLVIVPSNHAKTVFELSTFEDRHRETKQVIGHIALQKPIETLFEGIDETIYSKGIPVLQNVKDLLNVPEQFGFLFCGAWLQGVLNEDRKNITGLIKCFTETFKGKADRNKPCLFLKTSSAGFSETELSVILRMIEEIRGTCGTPTGKFPNIYVLHGDFTDEEINSLYNHPKVKAFVSFTKGEGFGRPLLEFTTTGKPVIASNWSGQVDFLNKDYSVLLPGKLTQVHPSAANDWIVKDSSWFSIDPIIASKVLMDVYTNYEKYLENSKKTIKFTKDNFSLDKMTEKLGQLLDKLIPEEETPKEFKLPEINLPKLNK